MSSWSFRNKKSYSEEEKETPRFEWRLRVQRLMQEENNSRDRTSRAGRHSFSSYSSRSTYGAPNFEQTDTKVTHSSSLKERRARFSRTKSEGYFKTSHEFNTLRGSFDTQTENEKQQNHNNNVELCINSQSVSGIRNNEKEDYLIKYRTRDKSPVDSESENLGAISNQTDFGVGAVPKTQQIKNLVDDQSIESIDNISPFERRDNLEDIDRRFQNFQRTMYLTDQENKIINFNNDQSKEKQYTSIETTNNLEECDNQNPEDKPLFCISSDTTEDFHKDRENKINSNNDIIIAEEHCQESKEIEFPTDESITVNIKEEKFEKLAKPEIIDSANNEIISANTFPNHVERIMGKMMEQEDKESEDVEAQELLKNSLEYLTDNDMKTIKHELNTFKKCINFCNQETIHLESDKRKGSINTINPFPANVISLSEERIILIDDEEPDVFEKERHIPHCWNRQEESCIPNPMIFPKSATFSSENEHPGDFDSNDEEEADTWSELPVVLLEDIYCFLSPKERHQASQVCRQWYDLFYSPRVWETFILLERTLTKKRFNLYKGYQRELCPAKTQICFRRVGSFFKRIIVTPISDYFNLYEFLRLLANFLYYQEDTGELAMPLLHTFDFTFACASRDQGGVIVHGTGGQILEMIKELLMRMSNLKHLKLNQLLLDESEVYGLFTAIAGCFGQSLDSLELLNVTKIPLPLTEICQFQNLIKLSLSPQHLNEEVILLLAGLNILQLHIVQDKYTCYCEAVPSQAWKLVKEIAPWLRVYLEIIGLTRNYLLIQPRAPVYGVFFRTPYYKLTNDTVMSLVEHYSKTLQYYVQEGLPRIHGPRGFNSRSDSNILFLVRRCPALHTLVINERISTATLFLIATEAKHLSALVVRRNALIKRCDWPRHGEWSNQFYIKLRELSLDFEKCWDEIQTILKQRWKPMTDKQFKKLKIVPKIKLF